MKIKLISVNLILIDFTKDFYGGAQRLLTKLKIYIDDVLV